MRPFRLPGGERAVRQPWRTAFGLLYEIYGDALRTRPELASLGVRREPDRRLLAAMLDNGINSPTTTSVGRLFDAVASLFGLCQQIGFEGQAAMALEFAVDEAAVGAYSIPVVDRAAPLPDGATAPRFVLDWEPAIVAVLDEIGCGIPVGTVAARFHNALVEAIVDVATRVDCRESS